MILSLDCLSAPRPDTTTLRDIRSIPTDLLSGISVLLIATKLVARIAPKKYLARHTILLEDVAAMNLSSQLGLGSPYYPTTVLGTTLQIPLKSCISETFMTTGGASLLITALWRGLIIRGVTLRDREAGTVVKDPAVE